MSFTSTSSRYGNDDIPDSDEPNNFIAPFWDDLYVGDGQAVYYFRDNTNHRFYIEYANVRRYSGAGNYNLQVVLYENGDIDLVYGPLTELIDECTIGIENSSGTEGMKLYYDGSSGVLGGWDPRSGSSVRFTRRE